MHFPPQSPQPTYFSNGLLKSGVTPLHVMERGLAHRGRFFILPSIAVPLLPSFRRMPLPQDAASAGTRRRGSQVPSPRNVGEGSGVRGEALNTYPCKEGAGGEVGAQSCPPRSSTHLLSCPAPTGTGRGAAFPCSPTCWDARLRRSGQRSRGQGMRVNRPSQVHHTRYEDSSFKRA
jgi:hypothetical protein